MEVIIDYNNDEVVIKSVGDPDAVFKIKDITKIQLMLEEIFNRIDNHTDGYRVLGVELSRYDEDRHFSIGEW